VVPGDNEAFGMQSLHMSSQGQEIILDGMTVTNYLITLMELCNK
jgi:hypothetical protein